MCWVENFSVVPQCNKFFLNGSTPNLPGILYDGTVQNQGQNQNRYKPICQKYKNFYMFATLYDTTNRIPVFSAYTFTGYTSGRPIDRWMIEPQLDNNNHEMQVDHPYQAGNSDYINSIPSKDVTRGHLFPNSHAHDLDTQKSTFTLTNIVPQVVSFNDGSWKEMERNVREKLMTDCFSNNRNIEAYVVTGAVPNNNNNNNKLNKRVNIQWTTFCCEYRQLVAGGGEKEDQKKTLSSKTLAELFDKLNQGYDDGVQLLPDQTSNTFAELFDKLNKQYGDGVQLLPDQTSNTFAELFDKLNRHNDDDVLVIPNKCLNVDTQTALPLKDGDGGDEHDHCVYDDDCVCSSVGVKGYYLPVVFVSVLVMMM
ncbi:endonuclease domain-containing 1 protein isoform X2 [Salvelinus sp. IW2-2015]|uniref:endonuclease domain-containing 1 protein isoform X3 n=1 Tax=Salvelinus sp. IW2-2015 TaxID=2691554 RepID=UPI000CEACAAE|nr:endonuclease domain-containing 1 protein-like isoform X2 [Salvelinus alpinus]XP_023992129.1 endonuclease domain-containing 1 protein-like isoform X2 [Salvelinus alpinus]XP_023992130.1 endonuclease domain-containing 1 protein-like isoform X2 [Salvelinus alpinus]